MDQQNREEFFEEHLESMLVGGVAFSEWCTFILKSVHDAFVHGADLATIITAVACIETYLKTENPDSQQVNLVKLIDNDPFLSYDEKAELHKLRKYRNGWVHANKLDDTDLLQNEGRYLDELKEMAFLSIKMLLTVLLSNQFI